MICYPQTWFTIYSDSVEDNPYRAGSQIKLVKESPLCYCFTELGLKTLRAMKSSTLEGENTQNSCRVEILRRQATCKIQWQKQPGMSQFLHLSISPSTAVAVNISPSFSVKVHPMGFPAQVIILPAAPCHTDTSVKQWMKIYSTIA